MTFVVRLVLPTILYFTGAFAFADKYDFEGILHQAETVKSADPTKFTELLALLNENAAILTSEQAKYLVYLNAYQRSYSGRLAEGIELYKQVSGQDLASEIQFKSAMSIVNNSAYIEDWQSGLTYANALLQKVSMIQDHALLEQVYFAVSTLYNNLGQHQKALTYSQTLLNTVQSPRGKCIGYLANLEAILRLNLMADNLAKIELANQSCAAINEHLAVGFLNLYLAEHYLDKGLLASSKQLLYDNLELAESSKYPTIVAGYHALLGRAHFSLGEFDLAQQAAEKTINIYHNSEAKKPYVLSLYTLYRIAKINGNFSKALEYHERYAESQELYLNKVREREIAVQMINLENLDKNNQIALLDKENDLLKTQTALANEQSENNRLALALSILVLAFLSFWLYRNKHVQRKLRKLAETDELTGISNRHYFNQQAEKLIKAAKIQNQTLSYILFDLDNFKRVNDTYGHQVGDWALKSAAKTAQSVCRKFDLIGRLGGEEFSILLPACSTVEAKKIAEICRQKIAKIDTSKTNHQFLITASFGIADSTQCDYDLDKLYVSADEAMYLSKSEGRNRTTVYQNQDPSENS